MAGQPAAFMTYVRFDDLHDGGQLTRFRELLAAEVQAQTGREFAIFQDRNDIAWGQNWQRRIDETLDDVTVLLVVVTPSLFRSAASRSEAARFLERERALGRDDLIMPIYYISTPVLDDPVLRETDELAAIISSRQVADWRELRFEPSTSPLLRKSVAQLARRIADRFWAPTKSSPAQAAPKGNGAESSISTVESPPQMLRPRQSAAFLSYAPGDHDQDIQVRTLLTHLVSEVQLQTGEDFPVLSDPYDPQKIPDLQARTKDYLSAATLLIAVITPAFFQNSACRNEVKQYLERERSLDREDLILPIYYISTPELDDPAQRESDDLAKAIASRQFADWRELRFEPWTSPVVRKELARLAARIEDVLLGRRSGSASTHTGSTTQDAFSAPISPGAPNRVFVSYSHKDHKQLVRLQVHLKPLVHQGELELWDDTRIQAGDKWREEIRKAIQSCRVAVLLISADFMASDFIQDNELPRVLNEAQRRGVRIFSVIVQYSSFEDTELAQYQTVNDSSRPLMLLSNPEREAVFYKLYKMVKATFS
jgi:hypothetical protein